MKPLPKIYNKAGYSYKLIREGDNAAMYDCRWKGEHINYMLFNKNDRHPDESFPKPGNSKIKWYGTALETEAKAIFTRIENLTAPKKGKENNQLPLDL